MLTPIIPIGSFGSVWSIFGVIYFLACMIGIFVGKAKTWLCVLVLALCGMCLIESCTPDPSKYANYTGKEELAPYIYWEGKWQNEIELRKNHTYYPMNRYEQPWENAKVYKIHTDFINPRVFHPDSLYWSPLLACGIGLLFSPFWILVIFLGSSIYHNQKG